MTRVSVRNLAASLSAVLWLAVSPVAAGVFTFQHVTLIDGRGGPPRNDMTVAVNGTRIASVKPFSESGAPSGAVIDGHGKYLMPGLMDVHIHLRGDPAPVLAGYLYNGVTTVADLGNQPDKILSARAAERAGRIAAPRIFAAGNLITAANGKSAEMGILVSDFAQARPLLERHIAGQKPDFAKLVYDEGGWPATAPVTMMPLPLLRDIARFYKRQGLRTIVHVVNEQHAREAIAAGIDALAHPVIEERVSDGFVRLMATRHIPFATTLTIGDNYDRLANHPDFLDRPDYAAVLSPAERRTLRTATRGSYLGPRLALTQWRTRMLPVCMENIRRIVAADGIAALGTDQSSGSAVHREMELLTKAGLTPSQIITIATYNSAIFLGRAKDLGSIEPGKRADLLLLSADPTKDVDNTSHILLVMKDGAAIDESTLPLAGGPQKRRFQAN